MGREIVGNLTHSFNWEDPQQAGHEHRKIHLNFSPIFYSETAIVHV